MKTPTYAFLALAFAFSAVFAQSASEREARARLNAERELLTGYLESARDSLQIDITRRYTLKQRSLEQREADKEELERLRERQERALSELARARELALTREQTLEDERRSTQQRQEEWTVMRGALGDVLTREAGELVQVYPLDREERQGALEELRRKQQGGCAPSVCIPDAIAYRLAWLARGDSIALERRMVIPDEGAGRTMSLARFGNVFTYGADSAGHYFMVRQTGRLGAARYAIDSIAAPLIVEQLAQQVPSWLSAGVVRGPVAFDIMQNDQSRALVAGKTVSGFAAFTSWAKKGGVVMAPLALLTLWGIILIVLKLVTFARMHTSDEKLYRTVLDLLDKKEIDKAKAYVASHRGVVAQVVRVCLEHSQWNRDSAEKAVKELLIRELPRLNKHLATLAVIAAAAPLLGLLGTVTGMINLFEVITSYGTGDPRMLAGGISEALITTQAGLSIAIPMILLHNHLRNRKDDIQAAMEKHAISILNKLWP